MSEEEFHVELCEETTADIPEDVLREIPKQDDDIHVSAKIQTDGIKPNGFEIDVKGTW